jgi:hypothetical protein
MQEHPDVGVVENLEDMWVLSKFQRDKKAKEEAEKQKKLQVGGLSFVFLSISSFQCFIVSSFHRFSVSAFQRFSVSSFQRKKIELS